MPDRTLPRLVRLVLAASALSSIGFALTLLFTPAAIVRLWPWPMTPMAARLLGASTLVSVPLALLTATWNRFRLARIPFVMLATYRVVQIGVGLYHWNRFDLRHPATWNYFLGGGAMLAILVASLVRGSRWGQPVEGAPRGLPADGRLAMGGTARWVFDAAGLTFMTLAVIFLVRGGGAGDLWFEAPGRLTPLTARLFASPMAGLALALWLIPRVTTWHEVAVPGLAMMTFGVTGIWALVAGRAEVAPPTPAGWVPAAAPLILLILGIYLWLPARRAAGAPQAPLASSRQPGGHVGGP